MPYKSATITGALHAIKLTLVLRKCAIHLEDKIYLEKSMQLYYLLMLTYIYTVSGRHPLEVGLNKRAYLNNVYRTTKNSNTTLLFAALSLKSQ